MHTRIMKILALFLLIGLASASFHEMLEDAGHDFVLSFLEGMERAPSLREYLGEEHAALADQVEDDIKTELGKSLKEGLDRVLEKIRDAVHEGKEVKQEFLDKVKELRNKLRNIKAEVGDKSKELMREIKERARDYLKRILERFGLDKRASEDRVGQALSDINFKDMLKKLKEHLKKNVDPELLKEKIEKIFGQGSELLENLLQTLKEKGKRKLEILIDALLEEQEDDVRETRGIKDYWEKVKDYFKDLKIDLQEKYMKFGEWVKEVLDKGKENSKDRLDNIRAIAKEFARHAKNVSKEIAAEAKEFFNQYKEDLGNIWEELKEAFDKIKNRKD